MGKKKIEWPSTDELIERLKTVSYTELGRQLGISRHSIKRHLRTEGITPPASPPLKDILGLELTPRQQEIVNGLLLGDGTLPRPKKRTHNSLLSVERARKDRQYLVWTGAELQEFCKPISIRDYHHIQEDGTILPSSRFSTRSHPIFTALRKEWYPKGDKVVPKNLVLTPLIVAVWFCDDGCISYQKRDNILICQLSTNSFAKGEVVRLGNILNEALRLKEMKVGKFHVARTISPTTGKSQYYLRGSTNAAKALLNYISLDAPEGMDRKVKRWLHF